MINVKSRSPQFLAEPSRVPRSILKTSSVAAAVVGVATAVLGVRSSDVPIVLVAVASWVIFALALRELATRRFRALPVVTASVIAVGLVSPFQDPEVVHALSASVILLAMAGHALRVHDGGDQRFLALVTSVWVSQLIWAQPWLSSFGLDDIAQRLIQTGLFLFGVKTVGMVTSALSVSERRFGSLLEASPVGMIEADFSALGAWLAELPVTGPDALRDHLSRRPDLIAEAISLLEIRKVNPAMLDLMRVGSRRALVEHLARTSKSPQALEAFSEQLVAIWEQRAATEMSFTAETVDGEGFSAMLGTAFPVNAGGDLILSQGVVSVTDLSGLVDALQLKNDLLASVGHELRTPLTSVAGFSRELTDRPDDFDDAQKAQAVAIIAQEADALSHVIDNLLVTSRADPSTLKLHMEPVSMATFLATISLDSRVISAGKRLLFGPCEAVLYADHFRLRQILRNLIDNAVTHGGDEITIDAFTLGDSGRITISDNGAGLPQGENGLIFKQEQLVARANGQPLPLGLGLPVALSLVRAMGGTLTHTRRDGLTTFEVKLDLPPASALSEVA